MLLNVPNILSSDEVDAIVKTLNEAGSSIWQDGSSSAYGMAKKVKKNSQCDPKHPVVRDILEKVEAKLLNDTAFIAAARPDRFSCLMINAYRPGMSYGRHLDASYIGDIRTDISVTLFLSSPTAYEGGDLVMETPFCEMSIKGEKGGVFLYPSTSFHRVEEVTSGTRLAIVGWLKSRIKQPHHREILFDLERTLHKLADDKSQQAHYMNLLGVKNRLLREWGE